MRHSCLSLPSARNFSTLGIIVLILSAFSFAAAPDRVTSAISSGRTVKLVAGIHPNARAEFDQGPVEPSRKLTYMTLLTAPSASQQRAMDQLLAQQQDPKSAVYHQWLTPEQYADRFGLSVNDVAKLTAWLKSQGFKIDNVARGRNWIAFSGTAAQVEKAFQTTLHNFNVDGEMHYANIATPSIPAGFSSVVSGVRGLNNFRAKSHYHRKKPEYTEPTTGDLFVAPGDLATIYDITPLYTAGFDGTGEKLAVMGRTDVYLADLNDFRAAFGLSTISCTADSNGIVTTACNTSNFKYVLNGPDPGVNPFPEDDLPEADLDLEWSGATARNAQIIYVNSGGTSGDVFDAYYYTIDNQLAPVITLSYGLCELFEAENGAVTADETELKKANMEGITFMNSSGDAGAATCDSGPPNNNPPFAGAIGGLAVSYPASSPEVTGVGGTMVPLGEYSATYWGPSSSDNANGGSALSYIPENGWNDDAEIGAFCAANASSSNCHPTNSGDVVITNAQTAQEDFWLSSSGGGASACTTINGSDSCTGGFAKPAYQTVTVPSQAAARFVPDVSLMASANFPGYLVCTPQFEVGGSSNSSSCAVSIVDAINTYGSIFGGTSVSTPVFAGMVTILNQYLAGPSSPGLGNINLTLYPLAASAPTAFHQVTAGNNEPGSNIVYCQANTPSGQPSGLKCPGSGAMGYFSANADTTTGYNLVTGLGSVDLNNLAIAWAASRTTSSLTVQASPTTVLLGHSVTLTATVSPSTATGNVNFFNNGGTTAIGTGTLTGGVATFTTTSLPLGTDTITASFAGNGSDMPATTVTPAVVTVSAPTFTWANTGSTTATVLAGEPGTYTFLATPTGSATFAATVALSCTGLPDATVGCTFSPTSIAAGAGATPVSVTITTSGPNSSGGGGARRHASAKHSPILPLALPLAGILLAGFAGRKMSKYSTIAGLCVALAVIGALVACGGGGSSTPPVTVSVTGTPSSVYPNNTGWPSQTAQFTATVANTTNTAVTWAVTTPNGGTISSTGLYTAPTITAGLPSSVTITATSAADSTKVGSATETLTATTVPGTYSNIMVTATESTTVHSDAVTLVVQ